ncbi:glutaredoxin family protein [Oceanidesulfovibrio indonesiensis]|uniref:glutaredoxin family protein n=1 Tax=Oceanidesulfovibrio indonesiensis TaxID=54767 RepID=UPI0027BACE50|nr:glutaredoxin family protein [Oceanidesulfovibrio indonesiensis]
MNVTVYALSTCIHCKNAKQYLDERKVPYEAIHVDKTEGDERKKLVEEVKKYNPACSFPTIVVNGGDRVIVGFRKNELEEALGL